MPVLKHFLATALAVLAVAPAASAGGFDLANPVDFATADACGLERLAADYRLGSWTTAIALRISAMAALGEAGSVAEIRAFLAETDPFIEAQAKVQGDRIDAGGAFFPSCPASTKAIALSELRYSFDASNNLYRSQVQVLREQLAAWSVR